MYISKNIKILRKTNRWNQTELGEKIEVSKAAVSSYESGVSIPPLQSIVKLAQLFEVSLDDLVLRDIEKEGTSGAPVPRINEPKEQSLVRLNELLEARVRTLEREIKRNNPDLAVELGIG